MNLMNFLKKILIKFFELRNWKKLINLKIFLKIFFELFFSRMKLIFNFLFWKIFFFLNFDKFFSFEIWHFFVKYQRRFEIDGWIPEITFLKQSGRFCFSTLLILFFLLEFDYNSYPTFYIFPKWDFN